MSITKGKAPKGAAGSRRTPEKPTAGRGIHLPWLPIGILAAFALLAGGGAYLIWQSGQDPTNELAGAAALEADPAPDLPGELVDLQTIYSGTYGGDPGTAPHVSREVDYETEQGLPPAGGPHWGSSGCTSSPTDSPAFCGPAPWGVYREPWAAATMIHNMEHGGAVVWYNTTDQAIIDELEALILDRLNGDDIIVLTPFPDMEEEHIALTTWARRDLFPVSEFTPERVEEYLDVHVCRFNPEDLPDC